MRLSYSRIMLFLVVLGTASTMAGAHALLIGSSPKNNAIVRDAPKKISLRFDARIEKSLSTVTLYDSHRKIVKLRKPPRGYTEGPPDRLIIPVPALKPGSYRLEYRVLATDGHLTPGVISFTIIGRKPQ